jgi:Tol biopolymer transport system component
MRRRKFLRLFLLAVVLLLLSLVGVVAWATPRLVQVSPAAQAVDVPAGSVLELTFSRPMHADSVTERLSLEPAIPGSYAWEGNRLVFTPLRPWPAGATVQVKLRAGGRASRFPALPLLRGFETSFTIRQPRLAFLYPSDGPANIFTHNPLTGEINPLTNVFSGVLDFDISPDGAAIYYSAQNTQGGSDLFRLSLSGEDAPQEGTPAPTFISPESVLACPGAQCRAAAVSPEGDFLAFERTALPAAGVTTLTQVWVLPLANPDRLFLAGSPGHQTLQPSWASNGRLAFYDTNEAAFIITQPGAGAGELARFPNQTGQPGDWQPGGAAYAAAEIFFLDPNTSGALINLERLADSHLLLYPLDGGETQDLTQLEGIEDVAPEFSPDGDTLAFARKFLDVRQWTLGRQLWLLRLSDGEARQLTNEALYNHYDFAWSPSGDRLAYVRFNQDAPTEPPEVWTIDPVTGQATQIIIGGYAPGWMP